MTRSRTGTLVPLFSIAIFLSAVLLFMVQPMITRMVLPILGGSPAVWVTAVMFFQAMLLLGYLYAHLSSHYLALKHQSLLHLGLLLAAAVALPVGLASGWHPDDAALPVFWLLAYLAASIGLPFFALSATAPLLQRWFAHSDHPQAHDPYFLYSASNLGALLILLAYPVVVEPALGLAEQSLAWSAGYALLVAVIAACGWLLLRAGAAQTNIGAQSVAPATGETKPPSWRQRLHWVALAFVPSALLLAVTLHISTDVAAVPFIWVVPLALFLLSFVFVFARRQLLKPYWMIELQAWAFIALAIFWALDDTWIRLALHLAVLFLTAMVCHGELARQRPSTEHLTEFFLWISVGGLLGGVFCALIAPLAFNAVYEYPLIILAAALLRPSAKPKNDRLPLLSSWRDLALPALLAGFFLLPRFVPALAPSQFGSTGTFLFFVIIAVVLDRFRNRPLRFALGLLPLLFASFLFNPDTSVLTRERSFFGVYAVSDNEQKTLRQLRHGHTMHGAQRLEPGRETELATYYYHGAPLGQVISRLSDAQRLHTIGVLGLGAGTLACAVQPTQAITFYELDPLVVDIARDTRYFTFLERCTPDAPIILGDGRLKLAEALDGTYDLLVFDAFTSDAVPMHLVTLEALQLYIDKLSDHGVLMFHISNNYVDLAPTMARLIKALGLAGRMQLFSPDQALFDDGIAPSTWVVIGRTENDIALFSADPRWQPLPAVGENGRRAWSDDYSNLFEAIRWRNWLFGPELLGGSPEPGKNDPQ